MDMGCLVLPADVGLFVTEAVTKGGDCPRKEILLLECVLLNCPGPTLP